MGGKPCDVQIAALQALHERTCTSIRIHPYSMNSQRGSSAVQNNCVVAIVKRKAGVVLPRYFSLALLQYDLVPIRKFDFLAIINPKL